MSLKVPLFNELCITFEIRQPCDDESEDYSVFDWRGLISFHVAIEGCCHGELDAIYQSIADLERKNNYKIDLLLICGDFQAVRNKQDLNCMSTPKKYKVLMDFWKYYAGKKTAPILSHPSIVRVCLGETTPIPTIAIISGNHEAANHMWELYHGGWLAPNIYFLGLFYGGLKISGASGIYKPYAYRQGHFEKMPYSSRDMKSVYLIREFNMRRLSMLPRPDVFLSHDWPAGIDQHGDYLSLLRHYPRFSNDIKMGTFGAPPLMHLLRTVKPEWWFSAHMHCRFDASVAHEDTSPNSEVVNQTPHMTRFTALDKCLPKRDFLEVVDMPIAPKAPLELCFDPEWLAITRAFQPWLSRTTAQRPFPQEDIARQLVAKEYDWVKRNLLKHDSGRLPVASVQEFVRTMGGPGQEAGHRNSQPAPQSNPQTERFCRWLKIETKIKR